MHIFIWAPVAADDLRLKVPKARRQGTVLVPAGNATVVVFTKPFKSTGLVKVAYKMRTNAVVFIWNSNAAAVYPVTGPVALGWEWGTDEQVVDLIAELGDHGKFGRAQLKLAMAMSTSKDNEGKQARAARRIAECLRASVEPVRKHVANRARGGAPAVFDLLEIAGQNEIAQIARLVADGAFDRWQGDVLPVVSVVDGRPMDE